jgi:outer membrane biogenesis lipoprotein LolB
MPMVLTKKLTILMLIGMSSLLQACSVAYDLQQDAALNACQKVVDWSQRSECIKKIRQASINMRNSVKM